MTIRFLSAYQLHSTFSCRGCSVICFPVLLVENVHFVIHNLKKNITYNPFFATLFPLSSPLMEFRFKNKGKVDQLRL